MRDGGGDHERQHDRRGLQDDGERARRPAQQERPRTLQRAQHQGEEQGRNERAGDQDQRIDDAVHEQRPGGHGLEHRQRQRRCRCASRTQLSKAVTWAAKRRRLQHRPRAPAGRRRDWCCRCRCCTRAGSRPPAGARGSRVPMRFARAISRKTPSRWKIWLIRSSARASLSLPAQRHRHAPRHLGEAELLSKRAAKAGSVK